MGNNKNEISKITHNNSHKKTRCHTESKTQTIKLFNCFTPLINKNN